MRRDLRYEFPRITHYFPGVTPTAIEHFTLREIDAYRVAAAETEREASSG